jgi:hypothetical protein
VSEFIREGLVKCDHCGVLETEPEGWLIAARGCWCRKCAVGLCATGVDLLEACKAAVGPLSELVAKLQAAIAEAESK